MKHTLKQIRENRGYTQLFVAEKAETSLRSYQYYETGKRTPKADVLQRIAKVLGCSIDELLNKPA